MPQTAPHTACSETAAAPAGESLSVAWPQQAPHHTFSGGSGHQLSRWPSQGRGGS